MVESEMDQVKAALIVTDDATEICKQIYSRMGRTVTIMDGEGMLSGKKEVLYCIITKYEVRELREVIDSVDNSAFVSISDVSEIIGNHVKSTEAALASA